MSIVLFGDAGARSAAGAGGGAAAEALWIHPRLPLLGGASVGAGVRLGPLKVDVAFNAGGERKVHFGLLTPGEE